MGQYPLVENALIGQPREEAYWKRNPLKEGPTYREYSAGEVVYWERNVQEKPREGGTWYVSSSLESSLSLVIYKPKYCS